MSQERAKPFHEAKSGFPTGHRLYRLTWMIVWALLARWMLPPFFQGWRRFLLRCFGAKIDKTAVIYPSVRIWYPRHLVMGPHSCMGPRVDCYCVDLIELREHAVVSQDAYLCSASHDIDDPDHSLVTRPIVIGSHAWVAAAAIVGPGVTVGDYAVLGAGGVAFKDLDPGMVYIGNPAQAVRKRKICAAGADREAL